MDRQHKQKYNNKCEVKLSTDRLFSSVHLDVFFLITKMDQIDVDLITEYNKLLQIKKEGVSNVF